MERVGTIVTRLLDRPLLIDRGARRYDGDGYRLDCCDECPIWSMSRRAIVSHRLRCVTFDRSVMVPLYGPEGAQDAGA